MSEFLEEGKRTYKKYFGCSVNSLIHVGIPYSLFSHALDGPLLLAEWTAVVLLHPQGHAAVVEGMVALSPNYNTVLTAVPGILLTLGLATETRIWKHTNN